MKRIIIIAACLASTFGGFAQSYEDFLKEQQQAMQAMAQDKEDHATAEAKRFAQFVKERDSIINKMDSEFSDYIKQRWESFESLTAEKQVEKPKPADNPAFKPEEKTPEKEIVPVAIIETPSEETPLLPAVKKSEPDDFPLTAVSLRYFGQHLQIQADKKFEQVRLISVSEKEIGATYDSLANTNYNHIIQQLEAKASEFNLNDWGYYLLTKSFAEHLTDHTPTAKMYQWFLLTKSGFKVKLAYQNDHLFLLTATAQKIYDIPYLRINGTLYYHFDGELPAQLMTYEKDFPLSRKYLDCNLYSPVNIGEERKDTVMAFTLDNKKVLVPITYSPNSIEFYRQYPKADIKVYFDASVHASTKESIKEALSPLIADKSFEDGVGVLLRFVQTAFAYKTDQDQFGYEKYFFADELFFYQYSDCEDRSVLFAYLVRELLDLEVVGLEYSGHMATAVFFPEGATGDYVKVDGEKFTICDPTYVNAPIGQTMPKFRDEEPKLIPLLGIDKGKITEKIISEIYKKGAVTADRFNSVDVDKKGNVYVTGHFRDTVHFDEEKNLFISMKVKAGKSTNDIFVNKYSGSGTLLWARKISGIGNDMSHSIKVAQDGGVLFAGTFDAPIKIGKTLLTPASVKNADMFVAKCSAEGHLEWVKSLGLDSLGTENSLFSAKFSTSGKMAWMKYFEEDEAFNSYGFSEDSTGIYLVAGASDAPGLGRSSSSFNDYIEYSPEEDLYAKSQELISDEYNPSVAGLFAALMLIENTGSALPGRSVQKTIEVHNPSFKKNSADIYSNLGKIRFMRNAEGIISIKTADAQPVMFNTVKVEDNSYLKISLYNSGNAKIDILSGVQVGKSILWYNLNYIKLEKTTGNLIFDYDTDHTQKTINLKRDILEN